MKIADESNRKRTKSSSVAFPKLDRIETSKLSLLDAAHDAIFHRIYSKDDKPIAADAAALFAADAEAFYRKIALCADPQVMQWSSDLYSSASEFLKLLKVEKITRDEKLETMVVRLYPAQHTSQIMQTNACRDTDYTWKQCKVKRGSVQLTLFHYFAHASFQVEHDENDIFRFEYRASSGRVSCDSAVWNAISQRLRLEYIGCPSAFMLAILIRLCCPGVEMPLLKNPTSTTGNRFSCFKHTWYERRDSILSTLCGDYLFQTQRLPRPLGLIVVEFAYDYRDCTMQDISWIGNPPEP